MLNNRTSVGSSQTIGCLAALIAAASFCLHATAAEPQPQAGAAGQPPAGQPGGPQAPAEKPEEPPTQAEITIDLAIAKLAKLEWVAAELVEEINMLSQKYSIKGSYRKGPSSRVYLRLTVTGLADSAATSLQVCDGETLWDYQVVLDSPTYRRLSVKPILERLHSPELNAKLREQAIAQMGLAGPETLLVGLRKSLKFEVREEDEFEGKKVWKLRGTWRTRQGLMGADGRPVNAAGFLPPYIPMDGTLYLGKEDGWPYKLTMEGRDTFRSFRYATHRSRRPADRVEKLARKNHAEFDHLAIHGCQAQLQATTRGVCVHGAAIGQRRR